MKASVIGLGKLGASMAAAFGKRGFDVIGVDVSRHAVDLVNEGHAPVQETDLEETIAANAERIQATMSHEEAVLESDISFVIVPTPSDEKGAFSLQYASWAFKELGKALKVKDAYHSIILTSTVLPGATRHGLLPILEAESGKRCGPDFGLCYSPEFIALGSVIRDFLNPDFTLVGQFDERAGQQLEDLYAEVMENSAPCRRMTLEEAELTKISVNAFVTTKITFANMIASVSEKIPGCNVDVVTHALGSDARIGSKYLKGALGYGGPCFPRDNKALAYFARELGAAAELSETTDRSNRAIAGTVVERLSGMVSEGASVAVLGLAYKPFSHVIEESQGIEITRALSDRGYRAVGYDPLAGENAQTELKDHAVILDSAKEAISQADAVVIATPDPEFCALKAADFKGSSDPLLVWDFWRILADEIRDAPGLRYVPFGCGIDETANAGRLKALWSQTSQDGDT